MEEAREAEEVKEEEEEEGIQVSRRRRAREENSRGHKSRAGGVGRWKEGSRWKVEEVCGGPLGAAGRGRRGEVGRRSDNREGGRGRGVPSVAARRGRRGATGGWAYGRLQTRGATCFMTSVHHIAPVS